MITGINILEATGKIESADMLTGQRFPKLNINLDKVSAEGDRLKVSYVFSADYFNSEAKDAKKVGHIKLSGLVEISDSKDVLASVVKKWNENRTLPPQMAEEIVNGLNFRCSATGTLVAYSMGLIPPLVISTTKIQEPPK